MLKLRASPAVLILVLFFVGALAQTPNPAALSAPPVPPPSQVVKATDQPAGTPAQVDTARSEAIRKACRVDKAVQSEDLGQIRIAKACVDAKLAFDDQTKRDRAEAKKLSDKLTQELQTGQLVRATSPGRAPLTQPGSGSPAPLQPPGNGDEVRDSAYNTPSACDVNGAGSNHPGTIAVRRELLAPKEASDVYGYRLGKRYIVYQVRVTNQSKDFQYIVADITVDLKDIYARLGIPQSSNDAYPKYLGSSRELSLLRGIPEKGQDYDPRNLTLHILQGVGSVAGGVSGLTPFSDVMGSAVANFNGAFLQAFVGIAPDHTATQLNRLSDAAFASNTLIDRLHTKVFAIFIPEALLFGSKSQGKYWSHPREILNAFPLDQVNVCIDGNLVTEVAATPTPTLSPLTGNIKPGQPITLNDSATDAMTYYTLDGSTPTVNSSKYSAAFQVNNASGASTTVQAVAISPNKAPSPVVTAVFTTQPQAAAPIFSPAAGAIPEAGVSITSSTPVATIYYTTDGTDPTIKSQQFNGSPILLSTTIPTIKAIAVSANTSPSDVASVTYMAPAAP